MLGAGSEASSPHGRNLSGDLTQKVRTKEVLCLSESLGFYTKSLARGRFLFLIPPPSSLDYRNQGHFRLIKESFPSPVVLSAAVFHLHPSEGLLSSVACSLLQTTQPEWRVQCSNGTAYPSKEQKRRHGDLNPRPSDQLPNTLPTELRGRGYKNSVNVFHLVLLLLRVIQAPFFGTCLFQSNTASSPFRKKHCLSRNLLGEQGEEKVCN